MALMFKTDALEVMSCPEPGHEIERLVLDVMSAI